jgi:hypothetical protein
VEEAIGGALPQWSPAEWHWRGWTEAAAPPPRFQTLHTPRTAARKHTSLEGWLCYHGASAADGRLKTGVWGRDEENLN